MSSRSIFEKNILRKTETAKQEFNIPHWKSLDYVSTNNSPERPKLFPQVIITKGRERLYNFLYILSLLLAV